MSFFSWIANTRNKKEDKEEDKSIDKKNIVSQIRDDNVKEGKKIVKLFKQTDRQGFIKENCELILESNLQIEEARMEYQAVTSYLTDMQRIDMIPMEERESLEDAARRIITLTKDRNKFQHKNSKITDQQYRHFERYETIIPKELPDMKENERYQGIIQSDLKRLEIEKISIEDKKDDIISKQGFLKGIAMTLSFIVMMLFCVFGALWYYKKVSMQVPFLLTVLMSMIFALYIFMESRKNHYDLKIIQMKQNRAILLINKVSIRSVNNRNSLEYAYSKFMVKNHEELKSLWEEYVKAKDEAKRYNSNTELLEFYHNEIINELKKFGVNDAEVWIYQPNAILDDKEMVEVRHRLNIRRQKLRERIDTNNKQKETAMNAIQTTMKMYPECEEEANSILDRYRIEL